MNVLSRRLVRGTGLESHERAVAWFGRAKAFFSRENTALIGRVTTPYPFLILLGILMIPVLFTAAGASVPVMVVLNFMMLRREKRFAAHKKSAGLLGPGTWPVCPDVVFKRGPA